jgi:xylulokinase
MRIVSFIDWNESRPMPEPHVIAIDQGTTNVKIALIDCHGTVTGSASSPIPLITLPHGGAEQDPDLIWSIVKTLIRQIMDASDVPADDVKGLICISQYSSIIPVQSDGTPAMNMVMHLDGRGSKTSLQKFPGFKPDSPWRQFRWLRTHGIPPISSGVDSVSHMRLIKYAFPEVYEKTAAFLEPMDFLTMKFTGRTTANQCTVLMMLGMDNRKLNNTSYHEDLIRYSGIDRTKWPELVPTDAIVGNMLPDVAAEIGLSPETQVITGANDTQAGGIATHAYQGDHGAISIGTTGVIITHADKMRTDVVNSLISMPSPMPNTYFVMAENGLAGKVVESFLQNLIYPNDTFADHGQEETFRAFDEVLASVPPGSNGVVFQPWMSGASAPVSAPYMRGGILNLTLNTSREEIAKATVEGVMMNLHWLRLAVEKFTKRPFSHITFYSGGALSRESAQIMADVFQIPIHQAADPEHVVALGGACLAFDRLKLKRIEDAAGLLPVQKVLEPRREFAATYAAAFNRFQQGFKRTRPFYKAINRKK